MSHLSLKMVLDWEKTVANFQSGDSLVHLPLYMVRRVQTPKPSDCGYRPCDMTHLASHSILAQLGCYFLTWTAYHSNRCQNWTILVHLLSFWVHFLQIVQANKGTCFDMQTGVSHFLTLRNPKLWWALSMKVCALPCRSVWGSMAILERVPLHYMALD